MLLIFSARYSNTCLQEERVEYVDKCVLYEFSCIYVLSSLKQLREAD